MNETGLRRLLAHTDLLAALAVVTVVTMLVIPLPGFLLSMLITMNIAGALAIVVATMYRRRHWTSRSFPACCC